MQYFEELTAIFESEDADLFKPKAGRKIATPDGHLVESFDKITSFVREKGRIPSSEAENLNEAVLGTQLNTIRADKKRCEALEPYDELGILELEKAPESLDDLFNDSDGLFSNDEVFNISKLPRRAVEGKNLGDIAKRQRVENFAPFKQLFDSVNIDLQSGIKKLKKFYGVEEILPHNFYVIDGLMCYINSIGEPTMVFGRQKERLHVIFSNGTESNMYLRTLASQLYEDNGFCVVDVASERAISNGTHDKVAGHIYVLKSLSTDNRIKTIANLYKIGVTTGSVNKRIKDASIDPTYLMAPVQLVEDYRLIGEYNPQKVEALIHRVFGSAKVDLEIIDGKGSRYTPSEWYSVPIGAINQAIELIARGEIVDYHYDIKSQRIVEN
jgi:hypothetical protein